MKQIENEKDLFETIEEQRLKTGMSLRAVSEAAGMSHSAYLQWKQGRCAPRVDTAVQYARAVGLRVFVV